MHDPWQSDEDHVIVGNTYDRPPHEVNVDRKNLKWQVHFEKCCELEIYYSIIFHLLFHYNYYLMSFHLLHQTLLHTQLNFTYYSIIFHLLFNQLLLTISLEFTYLLFNEFLFTTLLNFSYYSNKLYLLHHQTRLTTYYFMVSRLELLLNENLPKI